MFGPEAFMSAAAMILQWQVVVAVSAGIVAGIVVGGLPGLTTATAIAIVLPLSFFVDPLIGIPFLIGLYKGGIFGGSIPAILIATPGTGAAVATVFDGPALVRQCRGRKALDMALYASVTGDTASDVLTLLLIVPFSAAALLAGPPEMAAILIAAIVLSIAAGSDSWVRGTIMACLGILLATIGRDPLEFEQRLSFGLEALAGGIPLLPMLVGLFAVPEIARMISVRSSAQSARSPTTDPGPPLTLAEFRGVGRTVLRSTLLGSLLGIIPGVGQPVAAFSGYALAKRASARPESFGNGSLEGIAAAEAANNAVNGPTLVPLLTLGIPGDKITALLLGAFVAHGLRPGPLLVEQQEVLVLAILLAMLLSNALLLVIARIVVPAVARLITIDTALLAPIVLVLAMTGAYLYRSDATDLIFLAVFGLVGILARRGGFDLAPLVLAFILCEGLEYSVGQTLNLGRGGLIEYLLIDRPGTVAVLLTISGVAVCLRYFGKRWLR